MLRFAVQARLVPGQTIRERFAFLAQCDYDGIEVFGSEAVAEGDELRRAMREFPVKVCTTIGGFDGYLVDPDPEARRRAIAQIERILAATAALGAVGLITPASYGIATRGALPSRGNPLTREQESEVLLESLGRVAEAAERTGGTLLLEPLNRYEDRALNTLAEAVAVIERVGSPRLRLMPDFFHMNIEEADIAASLRRFAPFVGHVHLADSNRLLPGLGHTDFAAGFAALRAGGYDGWLSIECSVPGDPMQELPRAREFLWQLAAR